MTDEDHSQQAVAPAVVPEDSSALAAHDLDSIDEDLSLVNEALAALDSDDLEAAEALAARLADSTAPRGLPARDSAAAG